MKNIIAKGYNPNWPEQVFVIKKFGNTVPWASVINDFNGEEIVWKFCKNELQKPNQKQFIIGNVIKRKGDEFYFRWKGYKNLFNSWITKKHIVQMSECFLKPNFLGVNVKIEFYLSN